MKKNSFSIGLIVIMFMVVVAFAVYAGQTKIEDKDISESEETMADKDELVNSGEAAPDFSLTDLEGNTVSLVDLKGEKVYIKFWASWCSICLAGLSETEALAANAEANGFRVLTIVTPSTNGEKGTAAFKKWFDGLENNNFTVLLDEEGSITKKFGVRGYPTSAYIGTDGVLVKTTPGHQANDVIQAVFDDIN